jgi:EpsI family protein
MTFRDGGIVHRPHPEGDATVPGGVAAIAGVGVVAVVVAGAAPAYAAYVQQRLTDTLIAQEMTLPAGFTDWPEVRDGTPDWTPVFVGADRDYHWRFRVPETQRVVDLHIAFYRYQRDGAEVINSTNKVGGEHWQWAADGSATVRADGQDRQVNTARLASRTKGGRMTAYWFWVDGRVVVNPLLAKAMQVKANLLGGQVSAAAVAISAPYAEAARDAMQDIAAFLESSQPLGPALDAIGGE